MKDTWLERYQEAQAKERETRDVLVGFNANLDRIMVSDDFELDVAPKNHKKIENMQEFKEELSYVKENSINEEVDLEFDPELDGGELQIGGQAGIISNYLAEHGNGVIFYTPLLSEDLSAGLNEKILYPVMDGEFVLKNIRDASTTDRTKENIIVEFGGEKTSRVIFSQKLRGFGPYFRKGVEDNLEELEKGFERAIVSGFHDVNGNIEAKIKKSAEQLSKISEPVHLEFVHREKTDEHVIENILDEVDSVGFDENEMLEISEFLGFDIDELSLGNAFQVAEELISRFNVSRVALHTYRYHVTVTDKGYEVDPVDIRDGMLFGELCAISMADSNEISLESFNELGFEEIHLHNLEELRHFQQSLGLESFVQEGVAEIDDLNVVAIPTLIHEDPQRLVGMGDIISGGSFIGEIS